MNENRIQPRMPDSEAGAQRPKPDGILDPAGEAGWFLMRERENRGLSLEQVSGILGIHPYHLEATELGNLANMPTRAEALEIISAYANFLGFEPDPLLHHYVSFLPAPEVAPRRHPANPAPLSSAKILPFGRFVKLPPINIKLPSIANMPKMPNLQSLTNGNSGIVASVVAAFVVFSSVTWMLVPGGESVTPRQDQVATAAPEEADPMPTASTAQDDVAVKISETPMDGNSLATAEPSEPAAIAAAPQLSEDVLGAFIQENVAGAVEDAGKTQVAALQPEARMFGSPDPKVRLILKANRNIWLLIEDGKGNRVATQLLNKGDVFRVPDRQGLVATVQDGGAITYMIDGVEKGALGQPGAVLAAESLDIKKLEDKG
jgi:cytoskeleton protein RodZ